MKPKHTFLLLGCALGALGAAHATPASTDRVYTADQNTNTVSVIDPSTDTLLGQIKLGNLRSDVLSPLYKGEINVHGLGFSPDHKTLLVISNGSNSVTFVDTATNKVKGKTYIGRSPHEGFFTADGKEVWVVVRGQDYISVIDPNTYKEIRRIQTTPGPGMVQFLPNNKYAFVVNSFNPVVEVVDVASHQIIKRIKVVSPFSPFLQFTPDFKEVWMTHKDVGKVTRIDTSTFEITGVIDTGLITNHLAFAKTPQGTRAYVTVGGENLVKVYTTGKEARFVKAIPVGALPHGIWTADDSSKVYVGLENGDGVDVIDPARNEVVKHIGIGQAPQALVYVSHAVPQGDGKSNLVPRVNGDSTNVQLTAPKGDAHGFVVTRALGILDTFEVFFFKLKPQTEYSVYADGLDQPIGKFVTNQEGKANGTAIGPLRQLVGAAGGAGTGPRRLVVMEGDAAPDPAAAALVSKL